MKTQIQQIGNVVAVMIPREERGQSAFPQLSCMHWGDCSTLGLRLSRLRRQMKSHHTLDPTHLPNSLRDLYRIVQQNRAFYLFKSLDDALRVFPDAGTISHALN